MRLLALAVALSQRAACRDPMRPGAAGPPSAVATPAWRGGPAPRASAPRSRRWPASWGQRPHPAGRAVHGSSSPPSAPASRAREVPGGRMPGGRDRGLAAGRRADRAPEVLRSLTRRARAAPPPRAQGAAVCPGLGARSSGDDAARDRLLAQILHSAERSSLQALGLTCRQPEPQRLPEAKQAP